MKESVNPSETLLHPRKLEEFECPGGKIKVIDVEPSEQKDPVPVLVVPGWGETPKTFETSINVLADTHRRVLAIDQPRWGPVQSPKEADQKLYPKYEFTKALNILEVLKRKGIEKADVIAHSEGGIVAAVAASIYPDQFRSLVLVAPGGMMGRESPYDVASESLSAVRDFLKRIVTDDRETGQYLMTSAKETLKFILKNPKRALVELMEARLKSDIHGMLKVLQSLGVKIAIIHGGHDSSLPMDKMQAVAKRDQMDGFYSVRGDHFEIFAQAGKYTAHAEKALTDLAQKLKKEN